MLVQALKILFHYILANVESINIQQVYVERHVKKNLVEIYWYNFGRISPHPHEIGIQESDRPYNYFLWSAVSKALPENFC